MHLYHTTPLHLIDFEGTAQEGILEYGVVTLLGGNIQEVYTGFCRPREKAGPISSFLHGLRGDSLACHPPFDEQWGLFSSLRKKGLFVAHNASVESLLLRSYWPFHSQSLDFLGAKTTSWGPWLDTYALAKACLRLESYQLSSIIQSLNLEKHLQAKALDYCPKARRNWHNALYDAIAGALLLMYLIEHCFGPDVALADLAFHSHLSEKTKQKLKQSEILLE